MAGHSKYKNIMHKKNSSDAKRAKLFTKLAREISVAVKLGGTDLESNYRLRTAVQNARKNSMPNDNIKRILNSKTDDKEYAEITYEGIGPANVSFIVNTLTDNKNRTAAAIRSTFSKFGGALNSVKFNFIYCSGLTYNIQDLNYDDFFDAAVNYGANDILAIENEEKAYMVYCDSEKRMTIKNNLAKDMKLEPVTIDQFWHPQNCVVVPDDKKDKLESFIDVLEDNDDVQNIFHNAN